ncbi:MAG: dihydrofolate reductase [Firmicutes bacterium]|nr:dihydrofolate reductase [Bacillota bacterium]
MKAIVIVDKNWAIGRDGGLLVHLPGDLKYFKEKTMGHTMVMGRTTVEGLPKKKALPGRTTLVLTRKPQKELTAEDGTCIYGDNARICASVEDLERILGNLRENDDFVAGGASVYEQLLPYCDEALVTVMEQEFPADRYFPNLPELGWELASESEPLTENGVTYRFCVYRRP